MRILLSALSLTIAWVLAACTSLPQSAVPSRALYGDSSHAASFAFANHAGLSDLYVADYGDGTIDLLKNKGLFPDGKITDGINGPLGVTLDPSGNLYVANASGVDVTEYAPGTSSPLFAYSTGMVEPFSLAVSPGGKVYEVDTGNAGGVGNNDGFVNVYAQQSNSILRSCQINGHPMGIAIDRKGEIFVSFNSKATNGRILEYKGGLNGCNATMLGVQLGFVAGIALDKNANLIACDYDGGIDVIDPPYSQVTKRLAPGGRVAQPYWVSINASNTKVYVTSFFSDKLYIIDYASRRVVFVLGYFHGGIGQPAQAVDGPHPAY